MDGGFFVGGYEGELLIHPKVELPDFSIFVWSLVSGRYVRPHVNYS